MERTTAVDVLLVAYQALSDEEKDELDQRLCQVQLARLTTAQDELSRMLRSIQTAAQHIDCDPSRLTVTQYRQAITERDDLVPLSRIVRRLGSWRQAREAFELSRSTSLRAVEARLAQRKVKGKIWRYSTETLRAFFAEAVEHYGRVPLASELDEYRERRLEIARAKGDNALHLPNAGVYRRRWGSYEKACLAIGYTPDQVAERLERGSR